MDASTIVTRVLRKGAHKQDRFAVIVSGDGLKTTLATALARRFVSWGIGTARVRSISYFWSKKTPDRMSKDLARQLRKRLRHKPKDRFILVGYSFGGGTLPFAVNRLPEDLIALVDGVAVLAAPAEADFEFYFRSWLNKSTKHARDVAPEIELLSGLVPVLYMRGEDDYIGPSDVLNEGRMLTIKTLPGGHDFAKDYDGLIRYILDAFPGR
ncbi:MAG: AcvB/VirJ family lysyl-phosphatidylglycerol hydrolase [Alphaproteobacteria bacterium]